MLNGRVLLIAALLIMPLTAEAGILDAIRAKEVHPVTSEIYRSNCADCHYAYPAGLLPARSWKRLMQPAQLADHFGDNAEVPEATRQAILEYLTREAADRVWSKRSTKFARSIPEDEAPLRITQVRYFKKAHRKVKEEYVRGNPQVRSWSNCSACHTGAEKGIFDDDTVYLPGVGWWSRQ